MKDFRYDAYRFDDLDESVLARIEAEDALRYYEKHGRWPALISKRAWAILEARTAARGEKKESVDE